MAYHVVSGTINFQILKSVRVKAMGGNPLYVIVNQKNGIIINKTRVIKADFEAINGKIHIIDTVIVPP